jgi:cysteinyl-tRNA synthetase
MSEQSRFHVPIEWAKERLAEMDAALASLDREARGMQAELRAKAEKVIEHLRKTREEYRQAMNTGFEVPTAEWSRDKVLLDSLWNRFATELDKNLADIGRQVTVSQAIFRDLAAAQCRAWRDTGEKLRGAAAAFSPKLRPEIDGAVQQMRVEASNSEARLQKLMGARSESWAALNAALSEARTAFDRAVDATGEALKRANEAGAENRPEQQAPR